MGAEGPIVIGRGTWEESCPRVHWARGRQTLVVAVDPVVICEPTPACLLCFTRLWEAVLENQPGILYGNPGFQRRISSTFLEQKKLQIWTCRSGWEEEIDFIYFSSPPGWHSSGSRKIFLACDFSHKEKRDHVKEHSASPAVWDAAKKFYFSPHLDYWAVSHMAGEWGEAGRAADRTPGGPRSYHLHHGFHQKAHLWASLPDLLKLVIWKHMKMYNTLVKVASYIGKSEYSNTVIWWNLNT